MTIRHLSLIVISERQAFMTYVGTALQQAKEFFRVEEMHACE